MTTRLAGAYPEVAAEASRIDVDRSARCALAVAHWALARVGYAAPPPADAAALEALVDSLDTDYFDREERGDQAGAMAAFAAARALHSLHFAGRGDLAEALYEAIIATDDPDGALRACTSRV